jgi:microcystin-dependent protein
MSAPFIGEVRLVGFNFAPVEWSVCNGALVPISENSTLFNLIGTIYGGDGQNTFALPNLQSRVAVHQGTGSFGTSYVIGATGGVEEVTVTLNQYPQHSHSAAVSASALTTSSSPVNDIPGPGFEAYGPANPTDAMASGMISPYGGSQPHSNLQPLLALNWIIALYGVYPSQG